MDSPTDTPAYRNRFDNVDVLSLLDPNWLENSQAAMLIRMCRDMTETDTAHADRGVPVLAA